MILFITNTYNPTEHIGQITDIFNTNDSDVTCNEANVISTRVLNRPECGRLMITYTSHHFKLLNWKIETNYVSGK